MITFPTDGDIRINRSHTYLAAIGGDAFRKDARSSIFTDGTERFKKSDIISEGDKVIDLTEGRTIRVSIEADDDNMFMMDINGIFNELVKVKEELRFIDKDMRGVVVTGLGHLIQKSSHGDAVNSILVMSVDAIETISIIIDRVIDDIGLLDEFETINTSDEFATFAGEHGTDD